MEFSGDDWQVDIIARDYLDNFCLIDSIANRLYPELVSATARKKKLLTIPEMQHLDAICDRRCLKDRALLDKLREDLKISTETVVEEVITTDK